MNVCLDASEDLRGSMLEFYDTAEDAPPAYVHHHTVPLASTESRGHCRLLSTSWVALSPRSLIP